VLVHETAELRRVKGTRLKAACVYLFNDVILVAKPKDAKTSVLLCRFKLCELKANQENDAKWQKKLVLNGMAMLPGSTSAKQHQIQLCGCGDDDPKLTALTECIHAEQKKMADRRRTFEL